MQEQKQMSRREIQRLNDGVCYFAGPERGDCEHAIGLPGESVPGQHDGPDDTVDVYGKPNGWCWHCWHMHRITELEAIVARLPLTADGVPVNHGTKVFARYDTSELGDRDATVVFVCSCEDGFIPLADCYSTESAARAAAEKE